MFDRDALQTIKDESRVHKHGADINAVHENNSIDDGGWNSGSKVQYSDEIPPFDITISFLNEYGQSSRMTLEGVEILNEGMGMSIDDITTEKSCTFVARNIVDMQADAYE